MLVPTAIAIVLLWRRDRKAAGWLAVPALWPSSEFHYATLAQPVMTPILAVLLAVPDKGLAPVAITLDILWRFAAEPVRTRLDGMGGRGNAGIVTIRRSTHTGDVND